MDCWYFLPVAAEKHNPDFKERYHCCSTNIIAIDLLDAHLLKSYWRFTCWKEFTRNTFAITMPSSARRGDA